MTTASQPPVDGTVAAGGLRARAVAALRPQPSWRLPLVVFLWAQLVLLLWWAGAWPGLLSPDSTRYIIHVTTGPWTADHSVLYDAFVLWSLDLTRNVALLTFLQTTVAAAVLGYAVAAVRAIGVRQRWAAIPALVLPCVPSFAAFTVTVWKDVPFALCEILVAATSLRLLARDRREDGSHIASRSLLAALGLEMLGLTLFRNDGFLVVLVLTVLAAVALKGARVRLALVGVASLVVFFITQSVLYPALGIRKANSSLAYGTFYADIAVAYAEAPNTFTAADKALMARVAPLRNWRAADNCYTSDPLFRSAGFRLKEADALKNQLARLWFRTTERTPVTVVRTRLCRSAVAWNVLPPPATKARFVQLTVSTPANLYNRGPLIPADITKNVKSQPLNKALGDFTRWLRRDTYATAWQVTLYRGATWSYVAYLVLLVAARRLRRRDIMFVGAICLANQLTVIAANPAQLYRYMVGPIFVGMLLLPLVTVRRPDHPDPALIDSDRPSTADTTDVLPDLSDDVRTPDRSGLVTASG